MRSMPLNTRLSLVRSAAAVLGLLFGVMTPHAWAQVNPITALQAQVKALQQTVTALQNTVATQSAQIATLQNTVNSQAGQNLTLSNAVATLQSYVNPLATVLSYDATKNLVQLTGVNVQIVNGMNSTTTANSLGNLIIGYNENIDAGTRGTCAGLPDVTSELPCAFGGGTFSRTLSGSHNLVIGVGHGYTQWGGIVAGQDNLLKGPFAVISGGVSNTASGQNSSVSGGNSNTASGQFTSVSGGTFNTASGRYGSVSGGGSNIASGDTSSVSGGAGNTVNGISSSVSGGISISESSNNCWAAGTLHSPC